MSAPVDPLTQHVAEALATQHYVDRFKKAPDDPQVVMNVRGNWQDFADVAQVAILAVRSFSGGLRSAGVHGRADMTPAQIELARHALGLGNGRRVSYRNHFVTGPDGDDFADWMAMVEAGNAKRHAGHPLAGGDDMFWLTHQGAKAALKRGERLDPHDFPTPPSDFVRSSIAGGG